MRVGLWVADIRRQTNDVLATFATQETNLQHSATHSAPRVACRARGEWPSTVLDLPLVLSEAELAHVRGVSVRTLQRDRRRGRGIPYRRVGRKIFYAREAVLSHFGAS
jgi:hypothetical protein